MIHSYKLIDWRRVQISYNKYMNSFQYWGKLLLLWGLYELNFGLWIEQILVSLRAIFMLYGYLLIHVDMEKPSKTSAAGGCLECHYHKHETSEYIWQPVDYLAWRQDVLMSIIKRCKLLLFSDVCQHWMLPKTIHTVEDGCCTGRLLQDQW